jgi:hypothetical protein
VSDADANGDEDGEGRHEEVSDSKNVNKQTLVLSQLLLQLFDNMASE